MQVAAQETVLDVDRYIQAIINQNPGVIRILQQQVIAAGNLKSSEGVDDTVLSSGAAYQYTEPKLLTGLEPDTSKDGDFELALSRTFSATGTRMAISYRNPITDRDPATSNYGARYYQPSI